MADEGEAPSWVLKDVLPNTASRVLSVQMLTNRAVVVFMHDHALVGEKGAMRGVRLYRVDYPPGLFINGSSCPHCGEVVQEPVAKVARLVAEPSTAGGRASATKGRARRPKKKR